MTPAAAAAARVLIDQGKSRQAAKVIRRAWEALPNPDLLDAFCAIAPDETPKERLARFEDLFRLKPNDFEAILGKCSC